MNQLKKIFVHPLLKMIAWQVKHSQSFLKWIASTHFYGKGALVLQLKLKADAQKEVEGITYQLDLRDGIQRFIYFNVLDKADIQEILPLARSGGVYFDVGANVGFYSLQIAKKTQGQSRIFAFEPNHYTFKRLELNCSLNSFGNCILPIHEALYREEGYINFYESPVHTSATSSLSDFKEIARSATKVKATTLDHVVERESLSRIDLLKIDVEGHELDVLEGAKKTLMQNKIHHLFIEFNGFFMKQKGISFESFLNAIFSYGFVLTSFNHKKVERVLNGKMRSDQLFCNLHFCRF
jgi:FkbM family methyltransferase